MRRAALAACVIAGVLALAVAPAAAGGVSPAQLQRAGWDCLIPLPGDDVHCTGPGSLGEVLAGTARTATFLVFDTQDPQSEDAPLLGTELIIRSDLFHGQPCPTDPPSEEYTYLLPLLGLDYWACHRYDSEF